MKDVFKVRRSADGDDVLKSLNNQLVDVVTLTGAAETIEDVQSGTLFIMDTSGTGEKLVISLPAAAAGLHYRFFAKASGSQIVHINAKAVTSGTNDDFLGKIGDMETATEAELAFNGSSHNQIDISTDYNAGDYIELIGSSFNNWLVIPTSITNDISAFAAANSSGNTSE